MWGHRLRRWPNIKTTLFRRHVFPGAVSGVWGEIGQGSAEMLLAQRQIKTGPVRHPRNRRRAIQKMQTVRWVKSQDWISLGWSGAGCGSAGQSLRGLAARLARPCPASPGVSPRTLPLCRLNWKIPRRATMQSSKAAYGPAQIPRWRCCHGEAGACKARGFSAINSGKSQAKVRGVHPMLFQCWASVCDAGPTLKQHWVNVPFFLGEGCDPAPLSYASAGQPGSAWKPRNAGSISHLAAD